MGGRPIKEESSRLDKAIVAYSNTLPENADIEIAKLLAFVNSSFEAEGIPPVSFHTLGSRRDTGNITRLTNRRVKPFTETIRESAPQTLRRKVDQLIADANIPPDMSNADAAGKLGLDPRTVAKRRGPHKGKPGRKPKNPTS